MNIAFLSSLNPTDIHNWSGTLYYMYHHLEKNHRLTWTGRQQLEEAIQFHRETSGKTLLSHRRNMPGYSERC